MPRKFSPLELVLLSTVIGILATFAAPWLELRGTYAAWRIVEWHTFWRGEDAFQLASVVSASYHMPIEYATTEMQSMVRNLSTLGFALGAWHLIALIVLSIGGSRWRFRSGAKMSRVALEIVALLMINVIVVYLLATLLALPSSLSPKIDFRTTEDIHTNSLIWASVNLLPVAPILSMLAILGQLIASAQFAVKRKGRDPCNSISLRPLTDQVTRDRMKANKNGGKYADNDDP